MMRKDSITVVYKVLLTFVLIGLISPLVAQVRVPFTQRTSALTSPSHQSIYTIKGDYRMIGNTNLTLVTYGDETSNSEQMRYVDIDNVSSTLNSSSAELTFSTEYGANVDCSEVVYAGLYWIGRAHDGGDSPNTFNIGGANADTYNGNTLNGYTLNITSQNNSALGDDGRTAIYTFTPTSGDVVTFRFDTWSTWSWWQWTTWHGRATVQVGSGVETPLSGTFNNGGRNNCTITFNTPYTIDTGSETIIINRLRKRRTNNSINNNFRVNITPIVTLNKRKVKLRYNTEAYQEVTATANDIWYPSNADANIYAAYADVTDFVKSKGLGTYTVADVALTEGDGGYTGIFGGWSMVVVYKNSKMKWRDISVFDGYAFVEENNSGNWQQYDLPFSGYKAAQSGDIKVRIGIVAGEGDRGVGGTNTARDALSIQREDGTWLPLSHSQNTVNNFFVSSILTEGARNPNLYNNTGLDIVSMDIDNTGNAVIGNNDTQTALRYGTNQDAYVLMALVIAIDAYVCDLEVYNTVQSTSIGSTDIHPGDEVTYTIELKNTGSENILDYALNIPMPYSASYVSCSAEYPGLTPAPAQPIYNTDTRSIEWPVGTLPFTASPATPPLLATLTYTIKVTTDCFVLSNKDCVPEVAMQGQSSGYGELSGTNFSDLPMVYGYSEGACPGDPITEPTSLIINGVEEYINNNCASGIGYETRELTFYNLASPIPYEDVARSFPHGCRFYDKANEDLGQPADDAVEFTPATGFPFTSFGTQTLYAIPTSLTKCYWKFTITVHSGVRTNKNVTQGL